MKKYSAAFVIVLSSCLVTGAWSQSADWLELFRQLVNRDPSIQDAARETASHVLLPQLTAAGQAELKIDVAAIAEAFKDPNEEIRLQASALLGTLAIGRPDGTQALASAVPLWLSQFDDRNRRVRGNAVRAIAFLQPRVPAEALSALIRVVHEDDPMVVAAAIVGLARLAASSPEAVRELSDLASRGQPVETRRAVMQAIGLHRAVNPELIAKMGEALTEDNRDLVMAAIGAASRIGAAAAPLKPELQRLAASSADRELSVRAADAVERLGK